jgi:hypothetical protein
MCEESELSEISPGSAAKGMRLKPIRARQDTVPKGVVSMESAAPKALAFIVPDTSPAEFV